MRPTKTGRRSSEMKQQGYVIDSVAMSGLGTEEDSMNSQTKTFKMCPCFYS